MKVIVKLPTGKDLSNEFDASSITVGRSNKCDFIVPDESLSRSHAQLEVVGGDFFVTDLGSSNGVFLDGNRIPAHTKVKFNSYQQLSIGSLDFQIEDTTDAVSISSPRTITRSEMKDEHTSNEGTHTKNVRAASLGPSPQRKSTQSGNKTGTPSSTNIVAKIAPLLILLIGAGVFFYFKSNEEVVSDIKTTDENLVLSNVPPAFRDIKDDFDKDYMVIYANNGCDKEAALCTEMGLSIQNGEGIVKDGKDVFVFITPSAHLEKETFARIKDHPEANELVSLYLLLNSSLMKEFDKKTIGQVHLIILDNVFKQTKAYRFHPKYFAGNEITRMLTEIGAIIDGGVKTEAFWNYANPLLKTKTL